MVRFYNKDLQSSNYYYILIEVIGNICTSHTSRVEAVLLLVWVLSVLRLMLDRLFLHALSPSTLVEICGELPTIDGETALFAKQLKVTDAHALH